MKYAYLYLSLLLIVAAIGCGKGQDTIAPATTPANQATAQQTEQPVAQQTAAVSYDLSPEERSKALQFEQGRKTMISTPYKIMQVGDVYVFGVGIKNVMPKEQNFRIQLGFEEAKTTGGLATLIDEADEETMLGWMARNRLGIEEIPANKEAVVPLIVEVKSQIGHGESIIPGSYDFNVDVEYESSPGFWEDYETNTLTIKVKE